MTTEIGVLAGCERCTQDCQQWGPVPIVSLGSPVVGGLRLWRGLIATIGRFQPDVIHAWGTRSSRQARLAARWTRSNAVVVDAALEVAACRNRLIRLPRWLAPPAGPTIVRGRTGLSLCQRQGVAADALRCIPPGCEPPPDDHGERRRALRRRYRLADDAFCLAAIGPLRRQQRLKDAIWALDLIRVIEPQLHLLIVGRGPESWRLARYRDQAGLSAAVHFVTDDLALYDILPIADCYWQTDDTRELAPALLAAMASGIPVVATDTPAHREVIQPGITGCLFDVGDRAGLARQTIALCQSPDRSRQLGQSARQAVWPQFAAERMIAQHIALYRELVRPRHLGLAD